MGTLLIIYYVAATKSTVQNTYFGQTNTQAAVLIAAAYVAGTVLRIEYLFS